MQTFVEYGSAGTTQNFENNNTQRITLSGGVRVVRVVLLYDRAS